MGGKSEMINKSWTSILLVSVISLQLILIIYSLIFTEDTRSPVPAPARARAPAHTYDSCSEPLHHPSLTEACFEYVNNEARFICSNIKTYRTFSAELIAKCASNLWKRIRPKDNDPWKEKISNLSESLNYSAIFQRPSVHIVIVGDSHLRYLFESYVRKMGNSRVKNRVTSFNQSRWEDPLTMFQDKGKFYLEQYQHSIHIDVPLKISWWWDPRLHVFPRLLEDWLSGKERRPTVVIFGTALHYQEDTKNIYYEEGKEKAALRYTEHLKTLTPIVSELAKTTPTIFKLQDYLGRNLKRATNHDSNMDLYNKIAIQVFSGSPIIMWSSTVPLSILYREECWLTDRNTPTGDWQCSDLSHIGYVMTDQHLDMFLNDLCHDVME